MISETELNSASVGNSSLFCSTIKKKPQQMPNQEHPIFLPPKPVFNLEYYLPNFKVLKVFGSPVVPPAELLAMIRTVYCVLACKDFSRYCRMSEFTVSSF